MADYYKILGISPDADDREIRTAYRKLARKFHPDAGEGSSAEEFRRIQDAYDLLSDSEARKEYDRSREPRPLFRARAYSGPAPYQARSSHVDLRGIVNTRSRMDAEPVRFRSSMNDVGDPWQELLDYLFRDF